MCHAPFISLQASMKKNITVCHKFTNVNLKKMIERPGGGISPTYQSFQNPDPTFERL